MRSESEIIAMRDKLERYALGHHGVGSGQPVLTTLQWVCDPLVGDREVLDHADDDTDDEPTLLDALDVLSGPDPNWDHIDEYVSALPTARRAALAATARKLSRRCGVADKAQVLPV